MAPKFQKDPLKYRATICGFGTYFKNGNKKLLKILNDIFHNVLKINPICIVKNSFDLA